LASKRHRKVRCPCGQVMRLRTKHQGRRIRCPNCGLVFRAPGKRVDELVDNAAPLTTGEVEQLESLSGDSPSELELRPVSSSKSDAPVPQIGGDDDLELVEEDQTGLDRHGAGDELIEIGSQEFTDMGGTVGPEPLAGTPEEIAVLDNGDFEDIQLESSNRIESSKKPPRAEAPRHAEPKRRIIEARQPPPTPPPEDDDVAPGVPDKALGRMEVEPFDDEELRAGNDFWEMLPEAFTWPLSLPAILIYVFAAPLLLFLGTMGYYAMYGGIVGLIGGGLAFVILTSLLSSFSFNVTRMTVFDYHEPPAWPGMEDRWNTLFRPAVMLLAIYAVSAVPLYFWAVLRFEVGLFKDTVILADPIFIIAALIGLLYLPMAYSATATFDSFSALNPALCVPTILKIPLHYLAAYALVVLVSFIFLTLEPVIAHAFLRMMPDGYFLPRLLGGWMTWVARLYMTMVTARVMGIMIHANDSKLGWVS